jgi:outer membrane biogenesis lipoprotein LolB
MKTLAAMAALCLAACAAGQVHPPDELATWRADHPGLTKLPPFFYTQRSWLGYRPWRDPAVYALLDWAAGEPEAARALASSPSALEWALDSRGC